MAARKVMPASDAPSSSSPPDPSAPATPSGFALPLAVSSTLEAMSRDRLAEYIERAIVEVNGGARPEFEPRKVATAARALDTLLQLVFTGGENALAQGFARELAADLDERGIDAVFAAMLRHGSGEIDTVLALAPPDLRRYEVVPPEHGEVVARAANFLSRIKKSAADEAVRTGRVDDMKGLGRGQVIDRYDPASVRQGLLQFAHGARSRMPLLQGAGFIDRDFAAIDARIAELQEIESDQSARRAIKSGVIDRIWAFTLAVEGCFRTYRARVRLAAGDDAVLMSRLTAPLPRNDERRRPAGDAKAPPPIVDAIAPIQSAETRKDQ